MPTFSARLYDYPTLKTKLDPSQRIAVVSCGSCARLSDGLGGQAGLDSLVSKLVADGLNVVHQSVITIACSREHWRQHLSSAELPQADILILLSCDAGRERAAEMMADVFVLPVTQTVGKGTYSDADGARLGDEAHTPLAEAARRLGLYPGKF